MRCSCMWRAVSYFIKDRSFKSNGLHGSRTSQPMIIDERATVSLLLPLLAKLQRVMS